MIETIKKQKDGILLLLIIVVCYFLGFTAYIFQDYLIEHNYEAVSLYSAGEGITRIIHDVILLLLLAVIIFLMQKKDFFSQYKIKRSETFLPLKSVLIISLMSAVCILFVSLMIDWNVKVFYDFGNKMQGYEYIKQIASTICQPIKTAYITLIIYVTQRIADNISPRAKSIPFGSITALLTIGLTELLMHTHSLPWTYMCFMIIFGIIHLIAKKDFIKTYFVITLIYML